MATTSDRALAAIRNQRAKARVLVGAVMLAPRLGNTRLVRRTPRTPDSCQILSQGSIVAERFADWVDRHPEFRERLVHDSRRTYLTTDDPAWFKQQARMLLGIELDAQQVRLQACPA